MFHRPLDAYCICTCDYELEYLDFISESGQMNEEIYDRVVQCILNGSCPHATIVPQEYVQEASISPLHIVAAVGPTKVLDFTTEQVQPITNVKNISKLDPYLIALIKNNFSTFSMSCMKYIPYSVYHNEFVFAEKLDNTQGEHMLSMEAGIRLNQENIQRMGHQERSPVICNKNVAVPKFTNICILEYIVRSKDIHWLKSHLD